MASMTTEGMYRSAAVKNLISICNKDEYPAYEQQMAHWCLIFLQGGVLQKAMQNLKSSL
jgi:hypothetical protein